MRSSLAIGAACTVLALGFAACDTGVTLDDTTDQNAGDNSTIEKREKVVICHVGNTLPLYSPTCTDGCGDAGKIDLIAVPNISQHIDNPAHTFGGVSDYLPSSVGASGVGADDGDGNGVDDGCEIPAGDIDIEKATNGVDADDPNSGDAPNVQAGGSITWTYVVTNTGTVPLSDVVVTDDQGLAVSCPQVTLDVGESMTCTASGLAADLSNTGFTTVPGLCGSSPNSPLYENIGKVVASGSGGGTAQDTDPSHYCNPPFEGSIDIEKATNGVDADDPNSGDAPNVQAGDPISWTYVVTNTGTVPLSDVVVTDDQGLAVSCPQATLDVGESMVCIASGLAEDLSNTGFSTVPGSCGSSPNSPLYENIGKVVASGSGGGTAQDTDPSHYCNPPFEGSIDIEKATNGVDADDPNSGDAPQIQPGGVVSWTYVVTNTGSVPLSSIVVTDDQGLAVSCPQATLDVGESMVCIASGLAEDLNNTGSTTVPGSCGSSPDSPLYENIGKVVASGSSGGTTEDTDPSHYCNPQN